MSDTFDLRHLLESWPFDPENDARIVRAEDGREILQVRTPVGIEQFEMDGRPDGARPHDQESVLEYQLQRLAKAEAAGRETEFNRSFTMARPAPCTSMPTTGLWKDGTRSSPQCCVLCSSRDMKSR